MIWMARGVFGVLALCVLALPGCGFQLRGAYSLPYESIYIAAGDNVVGIGLKRQIRASGKTRIADSAEDAEASFVPAGEWRDSVIVSLSGSGRVREKRLRFRYAYRIVDAKGRDLVPQSYVELTRDVSYADSATLAKTQEEELLWRDMENDLVQQLMRRLVTAKPKPPVAAE
ncbi:MAG: LPS assembly lipoprotein LptE [Candidatus Accumulibacter sp.]|jgi:LPS-assembly lipoprotein|nr:LPS assembly lipoprotein LptE [Accumulibacter sp.]